MTVKRETLQVTYFIIEYEELTCEWVTHVTSKRPEIIQTNIWHVLKGIKQDWFMMVFLMKFGVCWQRRRAC